MERYSWDARLAPLDDAGLGASAIPPRDRADRGMTRRRSRRRFRARGALFDARWRRHAAMLAGVVGGAAAAVPPRRRRSRDDLLDQHDLRALPVHRAGDRLAGVAAARASWRRCAPQGWWPGLALVAAGGFGWLLGDASGVALFRHAGLVLMLQGAVVTVLGPNVARGAAVSALLHGLPRARSAIPRRAAAGRSPSRW